MGKSETQPHHMEICDLKCHICLPIQSQIRATELQSFQWVALILIRQEAYLLTLLPLLSFQKKGQLIVLRILNKNSLSTVSEEISMGGPIRPFTNLSLNTRDYIKPQKMARSQTKKKVVGQSIPAAMKVLNLRYGLSNSIGHCNSSIEKNPFLCSDF